MGLMDIFRRSSRAGDQPPSETRSSGAGYTAEIMAARESWIAGTRGVAELSATVQGCVTLWEGALAAADIEGTDTLRRADMAIVARSVALRGEFVGLLDGERIVPCVDWELSTRNGRPRAYRLTIPEAGGGYTRTALAPEVIHLRIGSDPAAPWTGTPPLTRARLTAGMLQAVEMSLSEAFEHMPLGSQIIPFPESPEVDLETLGRGFRGKRGRVMLRESVQVSAAGGPAPAQDWRPQDTTPDLQKAMTKETLEAARHSILASFGVLPALFDRQAQGPLVREAQRHLATWQLQPICALLAEELGDKTGSEVSIDVLRPLQAFDAGGRARALNGVVEAMAKGKEAGLLPGEINDAMRLVDWE